MNVSFQSTTNHKMAHAIMNPEIYSEEFFAVTNADIAPRLGTPPIKREYLVKDWLPLGIGGLLSGVGAIGKTTLAMQLGAAVATGTAFLEKDCQKGSVLLYLSEDDECEFVHRLHRIKESLNVGHHSDLISNLKVLSSPMTSLPFFDYQTSTGGAGTTTHFMNLLKTARQLTDLKLIVIDSYTRVNNLDEVNHSNANYVAEKLNALARDTGATVLMIHHPSKTPRDDQYGARGSGALVNALRWSASLSTVKKRQSAAEDGQPILRLSVQKFNYGPTTATTLRRLDNGVLSIGDESPEDEQENEYQHILFKVSQFIQEQTTAGIEVTARNMRDYAGLKGKFGVSEAALKRFCDEALHRRDLMRDESNKFGLPTTSPFSADEKVKSSQSLNYETI
jgi:RecA-family ATPase